MSNDERIKRMISSSHRITGTGDWARGRIMYDRFSRLLGEPSRSWNMLSLKEHIAWRELVKSYRICIYNTKGVKV
jgi:hypothetical protein